MVDLCACALTHQHFVSHRNIGCDVRGDFKLFDFGLAKELRKEDVVEAPDGFECTGLTGSRRWMAPENCLCKNYGLSADVYAYCLLFWHVMALKMPFANYDRKKHLQKVTIGGKRPDPKKMRVSDFLRALICKGWDTDSAKRPDMIRICELTQLQILEGYQKKKRTVDGSIIDRSGHFADQSMNSYYGGGMRT